eukprot:scaffold20917_cov20-Tisochrysis_lutea.AAC.2
MNERKSREGVNREPTILFAPNDRVYAPDFEFCCRFMSRLVDVYNPGVDSHPQISHSSLVVEAKAMKNVRWYNPRINKHSWENPDELLEWKPVYNPEREYCPTLKSLLSTRQYCIINWWYCVVHCGVLLIEEQGNGWTEWKLVYN